MSLDGGTEPVWNPNGRELFFRSGNKMMAVDVNQNRAPEGIATSGFSAGTPKVLFEGPYVPAVAVFPNYDVSSYGQHFLMLKSGEKQDAPTQINVVLNWFEELQQKVPVK